ncbi:MAG TPA: hypothetical protein PLE24_16260 [Chitinispirillaceae bacterium]|jgi:hypothetical protein|nr:hypothetical protein [Chitinispirillaceae bacterium]
MRFRWFLAGGLSVFTAFFLISAVPYGTGVTGRYQIAGTDKLIYILDTQTGEVRFCGSSGDIISFRPFSDSREIKVRENGYCGEGCCDGHGKYETGK